MVATSSGENRGGGPASTLSVAIDASLLGAVQVDPVRLLDHVAAVDDERLAGDVARRLGGEIRDQAGVPGRPTGVCLAASSSSASDDPVAIHPGATEFAVIPNRPYSSAIVRIIPSIAPFAVAYAAEPGAVT